MQTPHPGGAGRTRRLAATALRQRLRRTSRRPRRRAAARPRCRSSSPPPATPRQGGQGRRGDVGDGDAATAPPSPRRRTSHQQLGQAFAGGTPPDVFYVDAARFADYASVGALEPYARQGRATSDDFYPSAAHARSPTTASSTASPKDFSTLALQINTDLWAKAGPDRRRRADHLGPAHRGRQKLKAERHHAAGHRRHPRPDRRVHGAGRRLDRQRRTASRPPPTARENLQALQYVKTLLKDGLRRLPQAGRRAAGAARRSARARPR